MIPNAKRDLTDENHVHDSRYIHPSSAILSAPRSCQRCRLINPLETPSTDPSYAMQCCPKQ